MKSVPIAIAGSGDFSHNLAGMYYYLAFLNVSLMRVSSRVGDGVYEGLRTWCCTWVDVWTDVWTDVVYVWTDVVYVRTDAWTDVWTDVRTDVRTGVHAHVHLCAALSTYRNNQVFVPDSQVFYVIARYLYLVISVRA